MFKVKVYESTKKAMSEAQKWLKQNFPHGSFEMYVPDDESSGNEDFGCTKDAVAWIDDCFPELDEREGRLIAQVRNGVKTFHFIKTSSEEDLAFYEECDRKQAIFEEAGGQRELFIKDKAEYLKMHSPFEEEVDLEEKRECIHCESVFQIKDYKVVSGVDTDYIVCPHYPYCDGSIIDWMTTQKNVQVSEHIVAAQNRQHEPKGVEKHEQEEAEPPLAECELPAGEGLAVFYNDNPKGKEFVLVAVKRSMYEKMKEHLEEVLQPSQWDEEHNDRTCMILPAVFITDSRENAVELLLNTLKSECGFDEETIEKIKMLGSDVLMRLDNEFDVDCKIAGGLANSKKPIYNLRERVNRLLGKGDEKYVFTVEERP